jgi:hypothetical protein
MPCYYCYRCYGGREGGRSHCLLSEAAAPVSDPSDDARLELWRLAVKAPRMAIIDVLQRIKPPGSKTQNAYESDYATWAGRRITRVGWVRECALRG